MSKIMAAALMPGDTFEHNMILYMALEWGKSHLLMVDAEGRQTTLYGRGVDVKMIALTKFEELWENYGWKRRATMDEKIGKKWSIQHRRWVDALVKDLKDEGKLD